MANNNMILIIEHKYIHLFFGGVTVIIAI